MMVPIVETMFVSQENPVRVLLEIKDYVLQDPFHKEACVRIAITSRLQLIVGTACATQEKTIKTALKIVQEITCVETVYVNLQKMRKLAQRIAQPKFVEMVGVIDRKSTRLNS